MKSAHLILSLSFLLLGTGCSTPSPVEETKIASTETPTELSEKTTAEKMSATTIAVSSPSRPSEDRVRDAARKPAGVLDFFEVKPGSKVVDIMGGSGYYTEILSNLVGNTGTVYLLNNEFVLSKFAEKPLTERLSRLKASNIVRLDKELEAPEYPPELDAAIMILFYHDTFWMKTDRELMNKKIFDGLKSGGIYGIIDHHAEAGSGERDVKTLHRIDAEIVKAEILAAGFEWVGESKLLSHSDDTRKINVFDPSIRGATDRFIFKFRKP